MRTMIVVMMLGFVGGMTYLGRVSRTITEVRVNDG